MSFENENEKWDTVIRRRLIPLRDPETDTTWVVTKEIEDKLFKIEVGFQVAGVMPGRSERECLDSIRIKVSSLLRALDNELKRENN